MRKFVKIMPILYILSLTFYVAPGHAQGTGYQIKCIDTDGGDNPEEAGGILFLVSKIKPSAADGYGDISESIEGPFGTADSNPNIALGTLEWLDGEESIGSNEYVLAPIVQDEGEKASTLVVESGSQSEVSSLDLLQDLISQIADTGDQPPTAVVNKAVLREFACLQNRPITVMCGDAPCETLVDLAEAFTGKPVLQLAWQLVSGSTTFEQEIANSTLLIAVIQKLVSRSDHQGEYIETVEIEYQHALDSKKQGGNQKPKPILSAPIKFQADELIGDS
ncbi:MAG: hypothetical protein KDD53_01460 [Bdellovibrionales bacterium]|nr:hypothetical protein [Bdellovibrionales bacterium]